MQKVVVLYEATEESDSVGGLFVQEDTTVAQINWILDQAKMSLLG